MISIAEKGISGLPVTPGKTTILNHAPVSRTRQKYHIITAGLHWRDQKLMLLFIGNPYRSYTQSDVESLGGYGCRRSISDSYRRLQKAGYLKLERKPHGEVVWHILPDNFIKGNKPTMEISSQETIVTTPSEPSCPVAQENQQMSNFCISTETQELRDYRQEQENISYAGAREGSFAPTPLNLKFLAAMLASNQTCEIRVLAKNGKIFSGVFNDLEAIKTHAARFAENCYITLNPVDRPVTNRLDRTDTTTKDSDVPRLRHLLIDLDPIRPAGEASTEEQLRKAMHVAGSVRSLLTSMGYPEPVICGSGNGIHLLYRTNLPVEYSLKIKQILRHLHELYADSGVSIDRVVHNPSRITRLYGTINHKGGRRSAVQSVPSKWRCVTAAVIDAFYEKIKPRPVVRSVTPIPTTYNLLDLAHRSGSYRRQGEDGKHYVRCPFHHEHSDTITPGRDTHKSDTVIWDEGDRPNMHCSHSHCAHRRQIDFARAFQAMI